MTKSFVHLLGYWKEKNNLVFEGKEEQIVDIRDKCFHYFCSLVLEHKLYKMDDFRVIEDMLTDM